MLTSGFVNGNAPGAPPSVQLESGISTPGGVQNDTEWVLNLTSGRLDRFERLARLWRHIPWTLAELDHVVVHLQATSPSRRNQLDGPMLGELAQMLSLQDTLHLPVDELCAMWGAVPLHALRGDVPLFERAFNQPAFLRRGRRWPADNQPFDNSATTVPAWSPRCRSPTPTSPCCWMAWQTV